MSGKFEPKVPVNLSPPKDDPISPEELAKADGMCHHASPEPSLARPAAIGSRRPVGVGGVGDALADRTLEKPPATMRRSRPLTEGIPRCRGREVLRWH